LCVPWAVCVRLFPDAWFGTIAKFVGRPFVAMYRPLARLAGRFSRKGKASEEGSSHGGSDVGRGKSPVETIRVTGDVEKSVL
jgi:Ca2+-transporting ATPase